MIQPNIGIMKSNRFPLERCNKHLLNKPTEINGASNHLTLTEITTTVLQNRETVYLCLQHFMDNHKLSQHIVNIKNKPLYVSTTENLLDTQMFDN